MTQSGIEPKRSATTNCATACLHEAIGHNFKNKDIGSIARFLAVGFKCSDMFALWPLVNSYRGFTVHLPAVSNNLYGKTSHYILYGTIPCVNQMNITSMPTNTQKYLDSDHMILCNGEMVLVLFAKVIIFLFIPP